MAKKTKIGIIINTKSNQTAQVNVERYKKHLKYKKKYKISKKFLVHNPNNEFKTGETVKITETRPLSKKKHFIITSKIKKNK